MIEADLKEQIDDHRDAVAVPPAGSTWRDGPEPAVCAPAGRGDGAAPERHVGELFRSAALLGATG